MFWDILIEGLWTVEENKQFFCHASFHVKYYLNRLLTTEEEWIHYHLLLIRMRQMLQNISLFLYQFEIKTLWEIFQNILSIKSSTVKLKISACIHIYIY